MNRLRLAAMIVIALILVVHWALPGVARADIPIDDIDIGMINELIGRLVVGAVVFLVYLFLLMPIIEVLIVTLPLRRAITSMGTFALMVVVVSICSYLLGLAFLTGSFYLLSLLDSEPSWPTPALFVLVEIVVTIIEVIWIGAIAKRRLTSRPEASSHPTVASVRRLVVLANLVTATLWLFILATGLVEWLADLFT